MTDHPWSVTDGPAWSLDFDMIGLRFSDILHFLYIVRHVGPKSEDLTTNAYSPVNLKACLQRPTRLNSTQLDWPVEWPQRPTLSLLRLSWVRPDTAIMAWGVYDVTRCCHYALSGVRCTWVESKSRAVNHCVGLRSLLRYVIERYNGAFLCLYACCALLSAGSRWKHARS